MRALIVGCGYVGLPLGAELVRQGHTVFGLKRSADAAEFQAAGITPLQADITRAETLAGLPTDFDWVINCAASGGGDAEAYRQLYLMGNRNLIEWLTAPSNSALPLQESKRPLTPSLSPNGGEGDRRSGEGETPATFAPTRLKKFIYTSSTSVYGQNDGTLVVEADPVAPATETGQILVATENLLLEAASGGASVPASRGENIPSRNSSFEFQGHEERAHREPGRPLTPSLSPAGGEGGRRPGEGEIGVSGGSRGRSPHLLPVVILRLAGIYGPGRGHWFKQFQRGEARLEGDGFRYLNMVHRDDVVGAIIAALQGGTPGPSVFNVVDNEPVTQRDFFTWLAAQLGQPMPPSAPADAEANRKRGVTNKRVSNQRLRKMLGYRFKYPTFRQGYMAEIQRLAQHST